MKDKLRASNDWIVDSEGFCLGEINGDRLTAKEVRELTKTLVHRYNSHDALVEALEAAGRYHQGFNEEIGLKIRAALASIKEVK